MKERKLAEARIRASEKRMSAIFDGMQDTIYQADRDGKILWTTASIKQLLGYSADEVKGKNIQDLYVCAADHDNLICGLDENNGRLQHFESRLLHKDGSHVSILENSHYRHKDEEIIGIEGTIRDITALKHAKEELHKEKERAHVTLSSIGDGVITTDMGGDIEYMNTVRAHVTLSSIGDGVITTDMGGDIEYMNTVAEESTGWKLEDARGKAIMDVFNIVEEKSQEPPNNPADLCLKQGKSIILSGHLLLIHAHRKERLSVEVNASPIRDSNSDVMGAVLVFHECYGRGTCLS
jgi:PAS domain S-box-containing protein